MTEIHDLTVTELAVAIRAGQLSPVEITEHYLQRIERLNEQVGAFYTVTPELAREQAAAAEKAITGGLRGDGGGLSALPPMTGIPIPVKDLNMVAGVRLTFGSTVFADNVATEDDYVVAALRAAGTVITGKPATPDFSLPCYTETKIGPPARTPWDLSRSAGGSSGGAAAAVAAGLAPAAQGSDGGGSIRIPSSVCGLFGIKPSRGRISRGPLMPDLAGLATDGPLARTVADAALLLDAMTGNHPGDMYTQPPLPPGQTCASHAGRDPGSPDVVPMFEILWCSMATLAPIDPAQEGQLLPLTRSLRGRGLALKAPELLFAQAYLQAIMRSAVQILNGYDAVLSPTLASPPVPVGYFDEVDPAENFERQKRFTPYTALYNLSGQAAVSVPLHWNDGGLPIGVMLAGRMGDESTLISLSAQLEAARPWKDRHPPIW